MGGRDFFRGSIRLFLWALSCGASVVGFTWLAIEYPRIETIFTLIGLFGCALALTCIFGWALWTSFEMDLDESEKEENLS